MAFTESDISTFVDPDTIFGVLCALSGTNLTTNSSPDPVAILGRIPLVAFLIWINLSVFDIGNQRLPEAVLEDSANKPWRPIPSGLITPVQARRLLLTVLSPILGMSYLMGVWKETSFCSH